MGVDVSILIHKDSLKEMDLWDAERLINETSGRWHYFENRFKLGNIDTIYIGELMSHLAVTEGIKQEDRNFIQRFSKVNIVFATDTSDHSDLKTSGYISLVSFMYDAFERAKKEV